MTQVLTPQMVEARLYALSKEIDESHKELVDAETVYAQTKADYELALAKHRLSVNESGVKVTVGDKSDIALVACESLHMKLAMAEAIVKAARANAARIRIQVDIARSVGTSVRSSMDV